MAPIAASTPPPALSPPPALVRTASGAPSGWQSYTVRAGDTLIEIAARVGTTPSVIAAQNQLPLGGRMIRTGAVILVPGGPQPTVAPAVATVQPASSSYTVQRGDTIGHIALRRPVTARQIMAANGLQPTSWIRPGQVLQIPGGTPEPAAPAPAPTPAAVAATAAPPVATAANTFVGRTYPDATVAAAAAARAALKGAAAPDRPAMRAIVEATARRHGIDPKLALAISYQESGWDQRQVSVANAIGAMQVIPSSGAWASSMVGHPLDLLAAEDNATAGVVILRALTRSASSVDEAIAGYYQGLASVRAKGMYADTQQYVASVKSMMSRV